ncbi:MAG: PQQ-dependent sugar dehydrogenase [Alphaproteobacteria bacterium]|nr:PQQ-dependent sugar dehydrogenase [Alphaproteobacteria bacterium]
MPFPPSVAALILAVLAAVAAPVAAQQTRSGAGAFGGWRDDAPGVRRLITADDIGAAPRSGSVSNGSRVVPQPAGAALKVPDGFAVEKLVTGIASPRALAFAPNGDLIVSDSHAGRVLALRFEGGRKLTASAVFAEGLNQPYGLAFYPEADPDWLYVATTNGLVRLPYAGELTAAGPAEILFDDIPGGGHWTRSIAFSPEGETLFYSVGSQTNVAEGLGASPPGGIAGWEALTGLGAAWGDEAGRALVYAMNSDGSNRRVWATGLRNCSGMDVQRATGAVWCAVNERDGLGNDIPFDYATSVQDGGFFGWPWYSIGANADPRHSGARPDLADRVRVPDVLFQSHSAPLNIRFYTADAFGSDYRGDAFVALHGSWNRDPRTGYKIVRLLIDESGAPTGVYEDFVTGFVIDDRSVWGRPVGIAVSPDGALYFSEDGNGTIWRVTRQ